MSGSSNPSTELAEARQALAATRFERVVECATPVFLAARDTGRWSLASEAALLLGRAHSNLPSPADALRWQNESVQAAQAAGDAAAEALAWLQVAAEHARYERVADALKSLDEVGRLTSQIQGTGDLYALLSNEAAVYYGLGLLNLALRQSRRALEAAERLGDQAQILSARTNLLLVGASAHELSAEADEALAADLQREMSGHLQAVTSEAAQLGAPRARARAAYVAAKVHMMARDWDAALQCLEPLLTMEVELPQVLWCSVWLTHARLLHERGDAAGAREAAAKAETFAEPPRPGEPRTYDLRRRAEIAELLGRVEESLALYRRYHQRAQGVLSAAISARLVEFHERFAQKELVLENDALRQQNAALGVGLQNLSQIATTDPLTGLLNRRGLDAEVSALIAAGHPFALALVDVDHFKRINDGYSHVLGDRVLVGLAQSMVRAMREGDRLARYGGEEFAVLLPGAGWTQAGGVAERLRSEVEAHDWTSLAPGLAVTVSVGVAVGHPGADFASVLATADDMLYRAKAAGRNRVVGLPVAGAH